jgi:hypothetical protein
VTREEMWIGWEKGEKMEMANTKKEEDAGVD